MSSLQSALSGALDLTLHTTFATDSYKNMRTLSVSVVVHGSVAAYTITRSSFKRYAFKLRDIHFQLSECGSQLAAVVPGTVTLPCLGAFILCRTRQLFRFLVQQVIQRLLHTFSHQFFEFALATFSFSCIIFLDMFLNSFRMFV